MGSRQPVGLGKVCEDQNMMHGHEIPHGYVKVLIEYVKPNIALPLPLPFDYLLTIFYVAETIYN